MMKNEAGVRIEEMLCQLADATRIDGEIWRAAYTLEDKIAKNILREWIDEQIHSICNDILHSRKYLYRAIGKGGRRSLRHHLTGRLCDKFRSSYHRIVP